MSAVALQTNNLMGKQDPHQRLRAACNEFVSMATFSQMLRQARDSHLNSGLWSSPGQKVFTQQLDDVLLQRSSNKLGEGVGQALYRQLSGTLPRRESSMEIRA